MPEDKSTLQTIKQGLLLFYAMIRCHSSDVIFQQRPKASERTAMDILREEGTGLPGTRVLSTRSDS